MILAGVALFSLSCGGDDNDNNPMDPGGGGTADVTITITGGTNGTYSPNPANMTAGQTVRWVNNGSMTHTATHTSGAPAFNVTVAVGGTSGLVTLGTAGTYDYHCAIPGHTMSAQIVVAP